MTTIVGMDGIPSTLRPARFTACAGELHEKIGRSRKVIDDETAGMLLKTFRAKAFELSAEPYPRLQRLAKDCREAAVELAEAWDEARRWRRCTDQTFVGFAALAASVAALNPIEHQLDPTPRGEAS